MKLSNLPPGVTDRMIEEQAGAFQKECEGCHEFVDKDQLVQVPGVLLSCCPPRPGGNLFCQECREKMG